MTELVEYKDVSIVSAIIPQHRAQAIIESISANYGYSSIQFDARGSITYDHWYQRFLPVINPENEYLQFIVAKTDVQRFMAYIIHIAKLHLPGSGAVFDIPCLSYRSSSKLLACAKHPELNAVDIKSIKMKENLTAIFALVQSGRTDTAIRSAMQAGSQGPIVYYAEGRGIRDQIGWLKITKKPYEEVIMSVVDKVDKEPVIQAIVKTGRINMPGGGILYSQPVAGGVISLPTSMRKRNAMASDHQIVAAIDEIMGNSDWRDNSVLATNTTKKIGVVSSTKRPGDNYLLNVIVPRKFVKPVIDAAISRGAPGANVTYVKQLAGESDINASGFVIHHEMALIKMVLRYELCQRILLYLRQFCFSRGIENLTMYEQAIAEMIRYRSQ